MSISKNESGRSLIEMLAVISIISVITIGAISTMNYGFQSYRANASFYLVESTAQKVSDLYSWMRSYPVSDTARQKQLICSDVFDGKCLRDGNIASGAAPWGEIQISFQGMDGTGFKIMLTDVPAKGCQQLKTMAWKYVDFAAVKCPETGVDVIDMTSY